MSRRFFLKRSRWRGAALGLVCAALCWALIQMSLFRALETWVQDSFFFIRGDRPTSANVVIIGLDENSLASLDKPLIFISPELAKVIRHADQSGAQSIGVDIIVPEKVGSWPSISEPDSPGYAAPVGEAVKDLGNVVLARWKVGDHWQQPPLQWTLLKKYTNPKMTDLSFVNIPVEQDQFIRRAHLLVNEKIDGEMQTIPHLGFSLLAVARKAPIDFDQRQRSVTLGDQEIPLDEDYEMPINFVGPPGTFPVIPFGEVLRAAEENRPIPELKDAIVVVGVTALDYQDYHPVPYSNFYAGHDASDQRTARMSGPEIHAHIIATVQDHAFIQSRGWLQTAAMFFLGPLLGMGAMRFNMAWMLLLTVVFWLACYSIAAVAFSWFHWRLEIVGLVLLGGVTCMLAFVRRGIHLQRTLRAVKSAPIAKAFEADPGKLDLGGEHREVTVLFADIRGFTSFSERFRDDPQRVVALLNAYFTAVVPLIEDAGGTLNQYMGDGVMVIFGAPDDQPDHAVRAVRAAVAMAECVQRRAEDWAKMGYPQMRIGVGINTGDVVVGAIGSPRRLDYSAIGDTTNTAARIEAKNKEFGTQILISEHTLRKLPNDIREKYGLGTVDPIEVALKGKEGVLRLFPVIIAEETPKSA